MNNIIIKSLLHSAFHPTQFMILIRNLFQIPYRRRSNELHLKAAMEWLVRSKNNSDCKGCSASYRFYGGWDLPYPETTGYIISTFLQYASLTGEERFIKHAIEMGEWEIEIQLPSGAVRGGVGNNGFPIVFNTGMVILGWADLYGHTGDRKFIQAAEKACDWLCGIIEDDGSWRKFTYNKIPHAYHSRVAWSLLEVYKHNGNELYRRTAFRNIGWVLDQVQENGWIKEMGFFAKEIPFTHTIAYTLRGMLECSRFAEVQQKKKIMDVVIHASDKMLLHFNQRKRLLHLIPKYFPGKFNSRWKPAATYSCLTGNAQTAIVWMKIYQYNKDLRFWNAAIKIMEQLKETQSLKSYNPGIKGGIAGSYPIWGKYMQLSFPNWAAKFYADALMLQDAIRQEIV